MVKRNPSVLMNGTRSRVIVIFIPGAGPDDLEAVRVTVQLSIRLRTLGAWKRVPGSYSAPVSSQRRSQTSR